MGVIFYYCLLQHCYYHCVIFTVKVLCNVYICCLFYLKNIMWYVFHLSSSLHINKRQSQYLNLCWSVFKYCAFLTMQIFQL